MRILYSEIKAGITFDAFLSMTYLTYLSLKRGRILTSIVTVLCKVLKHILQAIMAKEGGWNPLRVLNTSRPFTPQAAGRNGRRGKGIAAGDLPRLVIKEEEENGDHGSTRSSMQDIRLPQISQTKVIIRKQFRQSPNSNNKDNGHDNQKEEEENVIKKNAIEELEPLDSCQQMLQNLLSRSDNVDEPDNDVNDSERVEKTVIIQADKLLQGLWEKKQKLPKNCFLPLSKVLFLLSSDDDNDRFLCGTSLLANYVEQALGQMDLLEDAEAALNSYGMLKLVSHNQDLLEALCLHGLVPLILLHLKILCQDTNVKLGKNVAFQMTACLRNCLNNRTGQEEFRNCGGVETLDVVTSSFSGSKEISCNLARLYSVLSQLPMVQDQFSALSVDALHLMVRQHSNSDELMVRTTFALGNIAAYDDLGRKILLDRPELLESLIDILDAKSSLKSNDKLTEDILVKTVRVFANLAVLKEGGQWAAVNDGLVKTLIRLLEYNKKELEDNDNYLLLSTLSAVCNLSYYPMVRYCQLLDRVLPHVLDQDDVGMAAEAARVVGNLSRIGSVRSQLSEKDTLAKLMRIADENDEPDDYARRDLRFALIGTFINIVVDAKLKESFLSLGGLSLGIRWLVDTRQTLDTESLVKIDWEMSTLVCKLLWNMLTSLPEPWRASVAPQMEDLEEILEELVILDREDNGEGQGPTEFSSVSLQLLEKASNLANQQ